MKTLSSNAANGSFVVQTLLWLAAGSAIFAAAYRSTASSWKDDDDNPTGDQDEVTCDPYDARNCCRPDTDQQDIPSHVQRESHKEERRKASVRFLAMKKPMYDNIEMYGPDDVMLCTIGKKKAHWYVHKKGLAEWRTPLVDEGDDRITKISAPPSIRLLFPPKIKKSKLQQVEELECESENGTSNRNVTANPNLYNISHKKNICVACGASTGLMRHYVVPYSYRRLLPTKFKSHLSHDVVLLCLECHICADQAAVEHRDNVYEPKFRTDPTTARAMIPDHQLRHVKSCAQALWKHREKMPPERVIEYEATVQAYLNDKSGSGNETLSTSILQELAQNLETDLPNPNHFPITELVIRSLLSDQDVGEFVRSWRKLFLEILQPRYLPVGWSVESAFENDSYE
ncbi:hypothetical protein IV203_034059 [Nitzschia inconspicua]|uniref:Uncharacterized protein n=1 Tax=Nitzschia inconspicua TaxID=303405 RepID=A0A9K3M500_9STRA|nr:hypothetical protein IV203_034059 [Nitzschia inconspicua]